MGNLKLDFNFDLKDQNDMVFGTANKILVGAIGNTAQNPHTHKLWGWVAPLKAEGIITLDKADVDTLRTFIDTTETMIIFMKGPMLDLIDDARAEAAAKEKSKD